MRYKKAKSLSMQSMVDEIATGNQITIEHYNNVKKRLSIYQDYINTIEQDPTRFIKEEE